MFKPNVLEIKLKKEECWTIWRIFSGSAINN